MTAAATTTTTMVPVGGTSNGNGHDNNNVNGDGRPLKKNPLWKNAQLVFYLVGAFAAVVTSVTVANSAAAFDQRCPLGAQLKFTRGLKLMPRSGNRTSEVIRIADDSGHVWTSTTSTCESCTYLPVGCAACAFIMAYFVMMCDRVEKVSSGSGSRNRMLGLFFPMLISSLLMSILMLISSIRISNGSGVFCQALLQTASVECMDAHNYVWMDYPDAKYVYFNFATAMSSSWISTVGCAMSFLVLILRCFAGVDKVPSTLANRLIPLRVASPSTSGSTRSLLVKDLDECRPGPSKTSSPAHV